MSHFLDHGTRNLAGSELLDRLASDERWDVLEAIWRSGFDAAAAAAGRRLASSSDSEVVDLVVASMLGPVAGQPDRAAMVQMLTDATCTASMAERVLKSLSDAALRVPSPELLWLLRQPGDAIDAHALDLLGDPSCERRVRIAAASRRSAAPDFGKEALSTLGRIDRSGIVRWVETVELIVEVARGQRIKGLAQLRRELIGEYLGYQSIDDPAGFAEFVLAAPLDLVTAVSEADSLPIAASARSTRILLRAAEIIEDTRLRVDLAFEIATRHTAFWSSHHAQILASWGPTEWQMFLVGIPCRADKCADLSFGSVINSCSDDCLDVAAAVSAAVHLDDESEAGPVIQAAGARLERAIRRDSVEELSRIDWSRPGDDRWPAQRALILRAIPEAATRAEHIVSLMNRGVVASDTASELVDGGHRASVFADIADPDLATSFVVEVISRFPEAADELSTSLEASHNTALVRGLAPSSPNEAFDHVPGAWDGMTDVDRDAVLELLERHATQEQSGVLDKIVSDTSGTNRTRRGRSGLLWARLASAGTPFPPGISSLLETSDPELARVVAQIASQVRPIDHQTLVALRDRWATADAADPARTEFRDALDAIDASLADSLADLERSDLHERGPLICSALGVTAGPSGFLALTDLVGPDSRDDDLTLRRSAAAALREYFSAHPREADEGMVTTLGRLAVADGGELDSSARSDLAAAFRSASLGEDAALAMFDPYLGGEHSMGEYLGAERPSAVAALNGVASRRAQGPSGFSGLVQQLDVVTEHIARATYLVVGPSDKMKQQIRAEPGIAGGKLPYGRVIDGLRSVVSVANMEVLHDLRSEKTEAHGADRLSESDVQRAEDAFAEAVPLLYSAIENAWASGPDLKVVDSCGDT